MTGTHTVVLLEVSQAAYDEIRGKIDDAGPEYRDMLMEGGKPNCPIDLTGIAVVPQGARR